MLALARLFVLGSSIQDDGELTDATCMYLTTVADTAAAKMAHGDHAEPCSLAVLMGPRVQTEWTVHLAGFFTHWLYVSFFSFLSEELGGLESHRHKRAARFPLPSFYLVALSYSIISPDFGSRP